MLHPGLFTVMILPEQMFETDGSNTEAENAPI